MTLEPSASETRDVVNSINLFAQEFLCEGMLLFLRDKTTVLLSPDVVARLLEQAAHTIYLVRLSPSAEGRVGALLRAWSSRLFARRSRSDLSPQVPSVPVGEVMTFLPVRGAAPLHAPEERTR